MITPIQWYEQMLTIRRFEERIDSLYKSGGISGTSHFSIGQEAVAVGTLTALRPDDMVVSTHRGHGHLIAKGANLGRLMAELLGRETGYCRGKGGSQNLCAADIHFMGTSGITGGGIPMATGLALAVKLSRSNQLVVSFFGDGATNQGTFHESLNMGSLWKLPILYICENNLYGMSVPVCNSTAVKDIAERAPAYSMPGVTVDGMDVRAVYEVVTSMAEQVRAGGGPILLECKTYRFCGHSKGDKLLYRNREEEEAWAKRDPLKLLREELLASGTTEEDLSVVEARIADMVDEGERFAKESPLPHPNLATEGVLAHEDLVL